MTDASACATASAWRRNPTTSACGRTSRAAPRPTYSSDLPDPPSPSPSPRTVPREQPSQRRPVGEPVDGRARNSWSTSGTSPAPTAAGRRRPPRCAASPSPSAREGWWRSAAGPAPADHAAQRRGRARLAQRRHGPRGRPGRDRHGRAGRMRLRRETVAYSSSRSACCRCFGGGERRRAAADRGVAPREREERVALMLSIVGLADHAKQRPGELSGGQQQRVAIARPSPAAEAAAGRRADRPARPGNRKQIMRLLRAVVRSEGVTALVATHDPVLIGLADEVLHLEDGKITERRSTRPFGQILILIGDGQATVVPRWPRGSRRARSAAW